MDTNEKNNGVAAQPRQVPQRVGPITGDEALSIKLYMAGNPNPNFKGEVLLRLTGVLDRALLAGARAELQERAEQTAAAKKRAAELAAEKDALLERIAVAENT